MAIQHVITNKTVYDAVCYFTDGADMEPKGRGGWLGFLIFQLLVVPLLILIGLATGGIFGGGSSAGSLPDGMRTAYSASVLISEVPLLLSGYWLLTGASRRNVHYALAGMWLGAASSLIAPSMVLNHFAPQFMQTGGAWLEVIKAGFATAGWLVIWTLYLRMSRRVQNTFPENDDDLRSADALSPSDRATTSIGAQPLPPLPIFREGHGAAATTHPIGTPEAPLAGAGAAEPDEAFWAMAIDELDSPNRRRGLWARSFATAQGNDEQAKAIYLRDRAGELAAEYKSRLLEEAVRKNAAERAKAEEEATARKLALKSWLAEK